MIAKDPGNRVWPLDDVSQRSYAVQNSTSRDQEGKTPACLCQDLLRSTQRGLSEFRLQCSIYLSYSGQLYANFTICCS